MIRIILSKLIMPLPFLWFLLLAGLILYLVKKKGIAHIVWLLAVLWLLIISTPFIPVMLMNKLEQQYPVFTINELPNNHQAIHILVLGGGHVENKKLPPNSQLSEGALARLAEGIRIHRLLPQSILITSGYSINNRTPQAIIAARAAIALGVDSTNIKWQEKPTNTWEEALSYKQLFGDSTNLILVTSANHMPRAMYLFHKAGLKPLAAPTDFWVKGHGKKAFTYWFPSSKNIERMKRAIHEYVGLLWYRMKLVTVDSRSVQ